jgi:predicted nucleic acid-binding protein
MIYIDATVFLYALLDNEEIGNRARALIENIQNDKFSAATSTLTFDEVSWIVRKNRNFEEAMISSKNLLELPNLTFIEVDEKILWKTYELMNKYQLRPRDAIHAACAITNGISVIISEDDDFDKIKEMERKGLKKLKL